ncbi:acyltransferase [Duganella sp. CT11-25]|jgi:acetyltransferase-like isoleucine patch superfamily enzyme|uniref:acyltransferase n=1 Tax=unclassified Duganella TaxID=2636909 RepID=UPI0039B0B1CA
MTMGLKLKKILALGVSLLPTSGLRALGYRTLLGYAIGPGTRIGFRAVIGVESFSCGRQCVIGRACTFWGPMRVAIGDKVSIGRWNHFETPGIAAAPERAAMNYARRLSIGANALIHEAHYFDLYGAITIGEGTWIAGRDTQFWTHGASVTERDITLGAGCYIGSAARFAPGSGLGDRVVAGLGAVISGKIAGDDIVVGGVPAKVLRDRSAQADTLVFQRLDTD